MKVHAIKAEYYEVVIDDSFGAAEKMLSVIAKVGISLLAYKSVSIGSNTTKFTLFAVKSNDMSDAIRKEGFQVEGPYSGLFIDGEDVPGALADIFKKLRSNKIRIIESSGIANINNGYGVVLYLDKDDIEKAYSVLKE
jgi:hypothetical protein